MLSHGTWTKGGSFVPKTILPLGFPGLFPSDRNIQWAVVIDSKGKTTKVRQSGYSTGFCFMHAASLVVSKVGLVNCGLRDSFTMWQGVRFVDACILLSSYPEMGVDSCPSLGTRPLDVCGKLSVTFILLAFIS